MGKKHSLNLFKNEKAVGFHVPSELDISNLKNNMSFSKITVRNRTKLNRICEVLDEQEIENLDTTYKVGNSFLTDNGGNINTKSQLNEINKSSCESTPRKKLSKSKHETQEKNEESTIELQTVRHKKKKKKSIDKLIDMNVSQTDIGSFTESDVNITHLSQECTKVKEIDKYGSQCEISSVDDDDAESNKTKNSSKNKTKHKKSRNNYENVSLANQEEDNGNTSECGTYTPNQSIRKKHKRKFQEDLLKDDDTNFNFKCSSIGFPNITSTPFHGNDIRGDQSIFKSVETTGKGLDSTKYKEKRKHKVKKTESDNSSEQISSKKKKVKKNNDKIKNSNLSEMANTSPKNETKTKHGSRNKYEIVLQINQEDNGNTNNSFTHSPSQNDTFTIKHKKKKKKSQNRLTTLSKEDIEGFGNSPDNEFRSDRSHKDNTKGEYIIENSQTTTEGNNDQEDNRNTNKDLTHSLSQNDIFSKHKKKKKKSLTDVEFQFNSDGSQKNISKPFEGNTNNEYTIENAQTSIETSSDSKTKLKKKKKHRENKKLLPITGSDNSLGDQNKVVELPNKDITQSSSSRHKNKRKLMSEDVNNFNKVKQEPIPGKKLKMTCNDKTKKMKDYLLKMAIKELYSNEKSFSSQLPIQNLTTKKKRKKKSNKVNQLKPINENPITIESILKSPNLITAEGHHNLKSKSTQKKVKKINIKTLNSESTKNKTEKMRQGLMASVLNELESDSKSIKKKKKIPQPISLPSTSLSPQKTDIIQTIESKPKTVESEKSKNKSSSVKKKKVKVKDPLSKITSKLLDEALTKNNKV